MSQVARLHHEAMDLCDQAMAAQSSGDADKSRSLYRQAFEREREAARLVADQLQFEPTRSVLHRSAASLALDCRDYRAAERLIAIALSGDPPEEIADELRDLLEQVNFYRHLDLRGMELARDEFQFSIHGKATSHGMAQSDAFLDRIQATEKLLFRTIERAKGQPFREAGKAIKEVTRNYELYLSVPRAASFAVTLKVGAPQKQLALPNIEQDIIDQPNIIIDNLMQCLEAFENDGEPALENLIPDKAYRRNFVALAEQIGPDGEQVSVVGLTTVREGVERRIALKRGSPAERRRAPQHTAKSIEVTGMLRFANSLRVGIETIKVVDDDNEAHRFVVPRGMMADIVKPLWDERVNIHGFKQGKKYILSHISKATDLQAQN